MEEKAQKNVYRVGRRWEYRVKALLEEQGYYVMRSASSKGLFDLIAVKSTHVRLIQCKYGYQPSAVSIEEFKLFNAPPNCSKEFWIKLRGERYFTVQEV